ncbi:MAG: YecA family protein [Gammaproteobacteria bacterium]|nr:YecA family protein [Gammaproteobacteria bacterium]
MPPESNQAISQSDLSQLDDFLRSKACGLNTLGISFTHGFLTALASGPERLASSEWLHLVFDEAVFNSAQESEAMLNLTLRLYKDIDHRLKTNVGFHPILDKVSHDNQTFQDAQPWCLGFTDAIKHTSENWTEDANQTLQTPLALIFRLADIKGYPDEKYVQICNAIPDAAEFIYTYWQKMSHP